MIRIMARKYSKPAEAGRQKGHFPRLRKGGIVFLPYDRDKGWRHELARVVAVQPKHVITVKLLAEFAEDERDDGALRETGAEFCVPLRPIPALKAFATLVAAVRELLTIAAERGPWTAERSTRWQRAWLHVLGATVLRTGVKAGKVEHRLKVGTHVRQLGTRG